MHFIILPILCKKTEIKRDMMRSLEENSIEKFARSEHFLQGKESFFALEIRNCLIYRIFFKNIPTYNLII